MSRVRRDFEECFQKEFPATFEAAQKGEPRPHGDMSSAWWGFKEGYRCALPTSEPQREKAVCKHCIFILGTAFGALLTLAAFWFR
ncbi:hypothetical protein D3C72_2025400 [compost metagenome]